MTLWRARKINCRRSPPTGLIFNSPLQHSVQILSEIQSRTFEHCAEISLPKELPLQQILLSFNSLNSVDLQKRNIYVCGVLKTKDMLRQTAFVFPFELDVALVLCPTKLQVFGVYFMENNQRKVLS